MAITISDKVGPSGQYPNIPVDVNKIANALNRISVADGGTLGASPDKRLDETSGIVTEKLLTGIQTFQLKQFGWPGADRRVFPGGQTITRINELLPDPPGPIEAPKNNIFFFSFSPQMPSVKSALLVKVRDPMNNLETTFFVKGGGRFIIRRGFTQDVRILWMGLPISISDMRGATFVYRTDLIPTWVLEGRGGFMLVRKNSFAMKLQRSSKWHNFELPDGDFTILEAFSHQGKDQVVFSIEGTLEVANIDGQE
ncbi:MAG: hypothetical protein R2682_03350 [Pyrinomonadaceae bacterium]